MEYLTINYQQILYLILKLINYKMEEEYDGNSNEFEIEDEEDPIYCFICNKRIFHDLQIYSYNVINLTKPFDENINFREIFFCSKKCWNEHILREAERIRFDLTNKNKRISKKHLQM
jgi:hypothetical protein